MVLEWSAISLMILTKFTQLAISLLTRHSPLFHIKLSCSCWIIGRHTKANWWFIAFRASQTSGTGAFFQSQNSGESVPCRDKWSKMTSRILVEYSWRIQNIRPLGSGTTLGLHLSTSLDLPFHLFPHPMCCLPDVSKQSQRRSGNHF